MRISVKVITIVKIGDSGRRRNFGESNQKINSGNLGWKNKFRQIGPEKENLASVGLKNILWHL